VLGLQLFLVIDSALSSQTMCGPLISSSTKEEMTAIALRDWCRFTGIAAVFIEPGSPWQNAYVESFNGKSATSYSPLKSLQPCSKPRSWLKIFASSTTRTDHIQR
jgi:transposase InsO family protein